MSEEKLEETPAKPEVPSEVVSDPKPVEEEKVTLSKADFDALQKAKEVGETYKKENEKYRHKTERLKEFQPKTQETPESLTDEQTVVVQNDYLSKREDVIEEFSEDISGLEAGEWEKIKPLVTPALDKVYFDSVKEGRYVPIGKLRKSFKELIDYARGDKAQKQVIENAKKETVIEMQKYETAEISGTKPTKKGAKGIEVTEEDRKVAEETKGYLTPERVAENRIKREEREKAFRVNT